MKRILARFIEWWRSLWTRPRSDYTYVTVHSDDMVTWTLSSVTMEEMKKSRQVRRAENRRKAWEKINKAPAFKGDTRRERRHFARMIAATITA